MKNVRALAPTDIRFSHRIKSTIKSIPYVGPKMKSLVQTLQHVVTHARLVVISKYLIRRLELFLALNKLFYYLYLKGAEFYQPLYNVNLNDRKPQRPCIDRADAVFQSMQELGQGGHILDIGCSLGYFSHYFFDRGFAVDGIDMHKDNIAICNLVKKINGSQIHFFEAALSEQFVNELENNTYDVTFLFSVLHHVVLYHGLDYTQKLVAKLLEKVPVLFIELATCHEETTYSWQSLLPKNELDYFAHCNNITIKKIGDFSTHLSSVRRPLYRIENNALDLCGKNRLVKSRKYTAYSGAEYFGRQYFDCGDVFIKKYLLANCKDNFQQIKHEIANYNRISHNPFFPRLLSYQENDKYIAIELSKLPGENLYDLMLKKAEIPELSILEHVIQSVEFLFQQGLYHNDIRLWNIMFDGEKPYLMDLGLARTEERENTNVALLWLIKQLYYFSSRRFPYPIVSAPDLSQHSFPEKVNKIIVALQQTDSFGEFLQHSPKNAKS